MRELMMIGIERDLSSSIAILDRLRPEERTAWLDRLERRNYRFALGGAVEGRPPQSPGGRRFAEALVEALRRLVGPADRVLLPRAKETRDVLVVELRRLGVTVTEVPAYQTRRIEDGVVRLREALASGSVDAVTFTSSSTARNFAEQFSDSERSAWRGRIAVASIGPITAATAAEYGLSTDVMPSEYTIPALARALADYFARAPRSAGRRSRRSE
jgi:uroporphyrinogen-III synthase